MISSMGIICRSIWFVLFAAVSFAARTTYPKNDRITIATVGEGYPAESIAFGDLNGDGHLDVVVGIQGAIYWVPSRGGGLFDAPVVLIQNEDSIMQADGSSSIFYAEDVGAIQVADMNGDGYLDVVAGCSMSFSADTTIFILINDGSGSFTPQTILPAKGRLEGPTKTIWNINTHDIKVADFKGNGINDIVATVHTFTGSEPEEHIAGMLLYMENNGSGVFSTPRVLSEETKEFANLALADYNGDGSIDFALLSRGRSILWLYENNGSGDFVSSVIDVSAISNNAVAAGDLDGDGDADIACLGDRTLTIYWNQGNDSFQEDVLFDCQNDFLCNGQNVVVFDADNDGQNDIITGPEFGQAYADTWFRQTEPGEFVGPERFMGEVMLSVPAFEDVNGDGIYDFVVASGNTIYAYLGSQSISNGPPPEEESDDTDAPTEGIGSETLSGGSTEKSGNGSTTPFRGSFTSLMALLVIPWFLFH